jgi:molybdopterin-guanine dinucleotide biosynthesis protein A
MGTPKEGVPMPDRRPMIEHVAQALRPVVREIVVVGSCIGADAAHLGARRLDDRRSGCGPLAAVEALLHSGLADHYLVVCCDQPLLTPAVLCELLPLDPHPCGFSAADGTEQLPFPCIVPATLAASASAALDAGERSVRRWLRQCRVILRPLTAGAEDHVRSFNTRAELAGAGLA